MTVLAKEQHLEGYRDLREGEFTLQVYLSNAILLPFNFPADAAWAQ